MKQLINIFDLDHTLIDSSHRSNETGKYSDGLDFDYWVKHSTAEFIMQDSLLPLIELFREFNKTDFTNIAVTAREMYDEDYAYLKKHGLEFHMILHRGDSKELDHVLKERKLKELFDDGSYIPFLAFDDKEQNLKVFEKFGFKCFNALEFNEQLYASR